MAALQDFLGGGEHVTFFLGVRRGAPASSHSFLCARMGSLVSQGVLERFLYE